jgi:hypothetical protein
VGSTKSETNLNPEIHNFQALGFSALLFRPPRRIDIRISDLSSGHCPHYERRHAARDIPNFFLNERDRNDSRLAALDMEAVPLKF